MDFFLYPRRNPKVFFSEPADTLACGTVAWAGMAALTHPLRVFETRLQQDAVMGRRRGPWEMLRVVNREGVFRGLGTNVAQHCAQRLMVPLIYEKWKYIRISTPGLNVGLFCEGAVGAKTQSAMINRQSLQLIAALGGGFIIGGIDGFFSHIFNQQLIQRWAADRDHKYIPKRNVKEIINAYRRDIGYTWLHSAWVGTVSWGVFFFCYEDYLMKMTRERQSVWDVTCAGMYAGMAKTLLTHPFETLLVYIQSNPFPAVTTSHPQHLRAAMGQLEDKGIYTLYRGIGVAMTRSALMWGSTFGLYELLLRQTRSPHSHPWYLKHDVRF